MLDEFDLAEIYELLCEYQLMIEDRTAVAAGWYKKLFEERKERINKMLNRISNARNK